MISDIEKKGEETQAPPFSVLKPWEKKAIIFFCATNGLWSTVSMPIYFPVLTVIQSKFDISDELMNLSVVVYLIFQGVSPTVFGTLADYVGRRPMVILSFSIYIAANIGLAVSDTYWLILLLRCVQAAGIAPVVAMNSGIVGDTTKRHERGSFMGIVSGIQLVGQGFGALIGAALASGLGWRAIFWFLAIAPGVSLLISIVFLPETRRSLVGNMSVTPASIFNKSPILLTKSFQERLALNQVETLEPRSRERFNPLKPFKMLMYPEVSLCLFSMAVLFTAWTMALTTFTTVVEANYGYGTMQVGLCYLPSGMGALVGALTSGKVLDYSYRLQKKKYDAQYPDPTAPNVPEFNIIRARCDLYYYPTTIFSVFLLIFAWTMQYTVHISVPLIAAFITACACMFPATMAQTVLVDIFPSMASTSISVMNLTRCWMGALFVGVLSQMESAMGVGGCFTLMAGLSLLTNASIWLLVQRGAGWVEQREKRERESAL